MILSSCLEKELDCKERRKNKCLSVMKNAVVGLGSDQVGSGEKTEVDIFWPSSSSPPELCLLSKKHDHDALISISISSTNRFVLLTKYTYVLLIYYLLHRYTIDRFNYFK